MSSSSPSRRPRGREDLVLVAAALLGPLAGLLHHDELDVNRLVLVAVGVFLLVRFTPARWPPLVIAAAVPEAASMLVIAVQLATSDSGWVNYVGSGPEDLTVGWQLRFTVLPVVLIALTTAAAYLAARLRATPTDRHGTGGTGDAGFGGDSGHR